MTITRGPRRTMRSAFSLIEVLVALALTVLLMGTLFMFYFNLLDSRTRLVDAATQHRSADLLIERLETELMTCIVGSSELGAGVEGSPEEITVLSRGVAAHRAGSGTGDSGLFSDLQEFRMTFSEGRGTIEFARRDLGETSATGAPLQGKVWKVRLRYYDGSSWSDHFNSLNAGTLPQAVEVAIWFDAWPGEEPLPTEEEEAADEDDPFGFDDEFDEFESFDDEFDDEFEDDFGFDEPIPDRYRIIVIPDAAPEEDGDNDVTGGSSGPIALHTRDGRGHA